MCRVEVYHIGISAPAPGPVIQQDLARAQQTRMVMDEYRSGIA